MPPLKLNWVNESVDLGPDPLVRAPIRQLTNSPLISWGVYCEQIYASTDGRRIAFMRRDTATPPRLEIWVADLISGEIARVGPAALYLMGSTPLTDSIYYVRPEGEKGRVLVRLDLATLELDDVFAFGDCASCPWPEKKIPVPPRAQAAHQQASHLTRMLARHLRGEPLRPYRYRDFGSLISLGKFSTVGSLMGAITRGSVMIEGLFAKMMYISLYKMHELALHGFTKVFLDTLARIITRRTEPHIKLH